MEDEFVRMTSGTLQGFAYECYVLAYANKLVKEFGYTKTEAINEVKKQLPREDCVVKVRKSHAHL